MTISPAHEDCSSIDPRVERVIDFIRSTIALACTASTNRINVVIEAILYIEKMKGYPRYQVRLPLERHGRHSLTQTFSAPHSLANRDKAAEEDP
jgi:hypothetical protein